MEETVAKEAKLIYESLKKGNNMECYNHHPNLFFLQDITAVEETVAKEVKLLYESLKKVIMWQQQVES